MWRMEVGIYRRSNHWPRLQNLSSPDQDVFHYWSSQSLASPDPEPVSSGVVRFEKSCESNYCSEPAVISHLAS